MKRILLFFSIVLSIKASPKIVAIALDGVNEEEGIREKLMKFGKYYKYWFGKLKQCRVERTGNMSLPAYANFLSGTSNHNVKSNDVDEKINRKTLLDLFPNSQLFSAWSPILYVVGESEDNAHMTSAEFYPRKGDDRDILENFKKKYNRQQFAFIHFSDGDNFAHSMMYEKYRKAVNKEVRYVKEIIDFVEDDTTVIAFTDHGRGLGHDWTSHGDWLDESGDIWMVVYSKNKLDLSKFKCGHVELHHLIKSILNR